MKPSGGIFPRCPKLRLSRASLSFYLSLRDSSFLPCLVLFSPLSRHRAWLEGRTSRQISLEVGDRITIIDPRPVHESSVAYGGWAYGSTSGTDGPSRGWFPLSFVRLNDGGGAAQGWGGAKGEVGGKRWTWPDRSAKEKKVTFQVRFQAPSKKSCTARRGPRFLRREEGLSSYGEKRASVLTVRRGPQFLR